MRPCCPGEADRRLELAATVLLALATVATAWAAYQARSADRRAVAGLQPRERGESSREPDAALANRQVHIEVATFVR